MSFYIRNSLPKYGRFLLKHPVYFLYFVSYVNKYKRVSKNKVTGTDAKNFFLTSVDTWHMVADGTLQVST